MVDNHELTTAELDTVSGGFLREIVARIVDAITNDQGGKKQGDALQGFQQMLQELP